MAEEKVSIRECNTMHKGLNIRLDSIDTNVAEMNKKLDGLIGLKGKTEFVDAKADSIGRKMDDHIKDHSKFIIVSLSIITLASIVVSIFVTVFKK